MPVAPPESRPNCVQPQQSCHQQAAANGQQDSRNQCGHARDAQRGDICKGDACAQKGYANAHQPFCGKLDAIRAFGMFRQEIQGNPQEQGKKEFGPSIAFRYEGGGKCHRDSYQYPGQQGLDTRERIRKGTFHGLSWVGGPVVLQAHWRWDAEQAGRFHAWPCMGIRGPFFDDIGSFDACL